LFFFSSSLLLWGILLAILAGCVLIPRFCCRYACPLGAALGLLSLLSPLPIKRAQQCNLCKVCEHACPTGAIRGPKIDFKECVRCDICEIKLIERAGTCRHSAEEIARRQGKTIAKHTEVQVVQIV
jgi:NosR/NirI family nitrous oxide reductase transcriptional regulator